LAFNDLQDELHWENLLSKGCLHRVTKSIDIARDKNMELLADFTKGKIDKDTMSYVNSSGPALINELRSYKRKSGEILSEDGC